MLVASTSWIQRCSLRSHNECLKLAQILPTPLAKTAKGVSLSSKSWEWKHFWVENARLWQRQNERTQRLRGDWSALHDEIFEDWNRSEHAEVFLKDLNLGLTLKNASLHALKVLANQLTQLGIRHFDLPGKKSTHYKPQFELGEFPAPAHQRYIKLDHETHLEFYSWDQPLVDRHLARICLTLSLIKTYSPESYDIFKAFTKRVIPIKQKEFVSYSLQSLPGHSFINLYHRDDLDLMDDLLHENGHHHLNHYLILENPLREDPEQIYYSPWRRSLRPIRGIYHAHLTFFFALKLYHDLAQALLSDKLEWPRSLKQTEKQKIFLRYTEESMMLEYTASDLQLATQRGQIQHSGVKLLKLMEKERRVLGKLHSKVLSQIDVKGKKKMNELKKNLAYQAQLNRR